MSITGFRQRNRMKPIGTGYRLYDTFKSQVLPSIKNAIGQNRAYQEEGVDETRAFDMQQTQDAQDFTLKRDNLARIAEMQKEANKPMNIVFDNFDRISAKDKKAFELAERGLKIRDENLGDKLELDKMKAAETARKNLATEGLSGERNEINRFRVENPELKMYAQPGGDTVFWHPQTGQTVRTFGPSGINTDTQNITEKAEAAKGVNTANQELRAQLERDLVNLKNDNSVAAQQQRARSQEQLARLNNELLNPSEQKQDLVNKATRMLAEEPGLEKYISIQEGRVVIKPDTPAIYLSRLFGDNATDINLPSSGTSSVAPDTEAPPAGAPPGGTWRTLRSGRRIYQPPS